MGKMIKYKISPAGAFARLFSPSRRTDRTVTGLTCEVARDLIPLYADGEASAKTRVFVEAHIAGCPECEDYYHSVKTAVKAKRAEGRTNRLGAGSFARVAGKIKRRRAIYTAAAALLIALSLGYNLFIIIYRGKHR